MTTQDIISGIQQMDATLTQTTKQNAQLAEDKQNLLAQVEDLQGEHSQFALDILSGRYNMTILPHLHLNPRSQNDVEVIGKWKDAGGALADKNPSGNTTPHGQVVWAPAQIIPPTITQFAFNAAANGDNAYMFIPVAFPKIIPSYFVDIRRYQLKDNKLNAKEHEQQFTLDGYTYNMAWQFDLVTKKARYFRFTQKDWQPAANVAFPDLVSKPVDIMAEFIIDTINHKTTHVGLTINGSYFPINITQDATPTKAANKYTVAEQLDSLDVATGKPPQCSVEIGNIEVRYL